MLPIFSHIPWLNPWLKPMVKPMVKPIFSLANPMAFARFAKPHRAASRGWHPAAVPRRSRGPGDLLPEALATGDDDFTNMKRVDLLGIMVV